MLLALTTVSFAQSGDEQGLEIPEKTSLKQDRAAIVEAADGWWKESMKTLDQRCEWYDDARFGCFIHWGVYSVPAGIWKGKEVSGYSEHLMRKEQIPVDEYTRELVLPFNPSEFNADEWMDDVEQAGMKYFIITAKHHDGFAMFPSDAYPYDIRKTAFAGRDPMMELRDAARKRGIKFGFYYSHAFDWEHPDAPGNDWMWDHPGGDKLLGGSNWWESEYKTFLPNAERYVREKSIPQIKELIHRYQPDILWFDTPHKLPLYLNIRILQAIREEDPEGHIVVNGRLVRFGNQNMGDYKNTGDRAAFFPNTEGRWEAIPTTNDSYGYSVVDTNRKPVSHFIRLIASAAAKGGNILMNIGPMGNGKWDERDRAITHGIGEWMKVNGRSIRGTQRSPLPLQSWGVVTAKADTLYAHIYDWPADGRLYIGGLDGEVVAAAELADPSAKIRWRRRGEDILLKLPKNAPDSIDAVVALTVDGLKPTTDRSRLVDNRVSNTLLAFDARLIGKGLGYADGKKNRNYVTNWKDNSQSLEWPFRLRKKASFEVVLEYNTAGAEDSGTVTLTIDDNPVTLSYGPCLEKNGTATISAGEFNFGKGPHIITLTGSDFTGTQYMRPTALYLHIHN